MNSHAVKPEIALSVRDLSVRHWRDGQAVKVVSDLSFNLHAGEALAVAGESGSGKTQTFLAAMGLLAPAGKRTARQIRPAIPEACGCALPPACADGAAPCGCPSIRSMRSTWSKSIRSIVSKP